MAVPSWLAPVSKRLEGKVALITGGASGIGEAAARLFVRHGAKVVIADIQDGFGQALCKDIGSDDSIMFTNCDVSSDSDMRKAVDGAVSKYGKLDIMFSNAGIGGPVNSNITETEYSTFKEVFAVNVLGSFWAAKNAARVMIPERKGSIIFTSSVNSIVAASYSHVYAASKHAVVGLANNLCVELGPYGIRVNCIAPFTTDTPTLRAGLKLLNEASKENTSGSSVNGSQTMLQPEEIAQAALYLGSDESKYVSGINLVIDGGFSKLNPSYTMPVKNHS